MLDIVRSCNLVQYRGKMTKTLISDPILLTPHSPLVIWQCCKLSSYAISRKTNKPNLKKWQKKLILGPILDHLAQIWSPPNFFLKVLPLADIIHCCKLLLYAISKKTNKTLLGKWQKTNFGTNFDLFASTFDLQQIFCGFYLH